MHKYIIQCIYVKRLQNFINYLMQLMKFIIDIDIEIINHDNVKN